MTNRILSRWEQWKLNAVGDSDLLRENQLIECNENEILERFYNDLDFGTGGLRGLIGVGTNRMNIYTVAKITQGYAHYINKSYTFPCVAIAYDSRIKSKEFAETATCVLAANNISVKLFKKPMPTPMLSFAIRRLECSGGIVITASHNPRLYNGYKIYGEKGEQITSKTSLCIKEEIDKVDLFSTVNQYTIKEAEQLGMVCYIDDSIIDEYIAAVSKQSLYWEPRFKNCPIVYTPLNGTGLYCVKNVLEKNGFTHIYVVREQEQPDGSFSTCPIPNPELEEAFNLGIKYALELKSELVLATDPDSDRIGIAVKAENGYKVLSGNEIGILLFQYICERRMELKNMPDKPLMIKSIVSTSMANRIAECYGVEVIEVLTGFKYIGEQLNFLEQKGGTERYIFGFEESNGYLSGDYVRDKDGVNAALLACEMYTYYKSKGINLLDELNRIYQKYGYQCDVLKTYTFNGKSGGEKISWIMEQLRQNAPSKFSDKFVVSIKDYNTSRQPITSHSKTLLELPKSNVMKFELESRTSVIIRPSGTEPKLKVYLSINADGKTSAEHIAKAIISDINRRLDEYMD